MPEPADDTALLLAAGRGDRQAFGVLVEQHHRTVVHFVYRFLGIADRATAEDIAQDVFLAAWKAAPSFKPRAAVRTWLLRITANKCLNHKRARRRRPTVPLVTEPASPADDVAELDLSARLQAAVADLVPRQRAAVLLRHAHGLSLPDIAAVLGTTPPVVKALLFRAHRRLRQIIDPE
ncbi:MAG: RNA polymerase sigma factor [Planctomycetota bacterium]|jgi:RNA polymerase sigma-70 factor (ECF subfamily)